MASLTLNLAGASKYYGSNEGEPETIRPPRNAAAPMSLLTFAGSGKEYINGLVPIWAAADPVSSTLTIDDFDESSPIQKKTISVNSYQGTIINRGEGTIKKTMQWKYSTTKSTKITVNKWWSMRGSAKYMVKLSIKAKLGVPIIGGVESGAETGMESALEEGTGNTFANGETKSSTHEQTITDEITVGPGTAVHGIATWIQYSADDVIWRGTMTSKYADGSTKAQFPYPPTYSTY